MFLLWYFGSLRRSLPSSGEECPQVALWLLGAQSAMGVFEGPCVLALVLARNLEAVMVSSYTCGSAFPGFSTQASVLSLGRRGGRHYIGFHRAYRLWIGAFQVTVYREGTSEALEDLPPSPGSLLLLHLHS